MPKNQKPKLYVITNVVDQVEAHNKQIRIERRKRFIKNFAIGAAIGYTVMTAVRMVADANSYDDTQEETED